MARLLSRLRDFGTTGLPSYVLTWSQRVCEQIEAAFTNQQLQLDDINAILDPNTLTPDKKPVWIFMDSYLTGEQSDLDAKATTYGITSEKTAYDNAISALASYLATLTTPVAWNDTSGNTTIVDATFRGKFTDVLTAKQALINTMQASAKTLADNAQSAADAVKKTDKISASWTSPGQILSATDAGTSATITILSHVRKYGDGTQVSITGDVLTGLSYSTKYYVYYDDNGVAGGSVTFHSTTNPNTAEYNSSAGRHLCGSITTPASGGGSTSGGVTPVGGVYSGPGEIP